MAPFLLIRSERILHFEGLPFIFYRFFTKKLSYTVQNTFAGITESINNGFTAFP